MRKCVLAFDLGGTKLAAATVAEDGEILNTVREPVEPEKGIDALYDQIARLGFTLCQNVTCEAAGIASAGPLDPRKGVLLDPTNFKTDGRGWGIVPLVEEVEKRLKLRVTLENDAAAAVLAERWQGAAQDCADSLVLTLGTGVGVGVIANGQLVRSGRHLHPEGGHLIIEHEKKEALCGCGNYGCAEAYLSGVNFTRLVSQRWQEPVTTKELVDLARSGDARALEEFRQYSERMALYMRSLIVLYAPQVIVLSGGFSMNADLFLPQTQEHLQQLMERRRQGVDLLPDIRLSPFREEAGLLGAARVAFDSIVNR